MEYEVDVKIDVDDVDDVDEVDDVDDVDVKVDVDKVSGYLLSLVCVPRASSSPA
jgi:hypothetical protein